MSLNPRSALATTLLSLSLLSLAVTSSVADAALKVEGKPKVSFFATGSPGFLDIEGVTSTVSVADDGTKLVFSVPMTTVKTGIDLRDDHMNNEYVQVAQFTNAVLTAQRANLTWPTEVGAKTKGKADADFNIHGVPQAVKVDYVIEKSKTGFKITGKFNFDCAKSNLVIPSYLGVTVDPKMRAEVSMDVVDAP
jgi:polyisoprenoid-binding protein YceI